MGFSVDSDLQVDVMDVPPTEEQLGAEAAAEHSLALAGLGESAGDIQGTRSNRKGSGEPSFDASRSKAGGKPRPRAR